jgi:hypothetical protein
VYLYTYLKTILIQRHTTSWRVHALASSGYTHRGIAPQLSDLFFQLFFMIAMTLDICFETGRTLWKNLIILVR